MNKSIVDPNRRELLRDSARYALLGGLGMMTGWLVWRGNPIVPCGRAGACRQCGSLAACTRPEAKACRRKDGGAA